MSVVRVEQEILKQMTTNRADNVLSLSAGAGVMLVFLRPFGCIFCRHGLSVISQKRAVIEDLGLQLVFVHMTTNDVADEYFAQYEIPDPIHISDPDCRYYAAFGLLKGTFTQLFGLQTWIKGFQMGAVNGFSRGANLGDDFQMPGLFVIRNGVILDAFIHKLASDQPDYETLLRNCCGLPEALS